jgi:hypothetical protein
MLSNLVDVWRRIIVGEGKSWVLFEHGTCVILMEPGADLAAQATEILREFGPVYAGSPAGDFTTITLEDHPGWVVTGHHPDVLNYVAPQEAPEATDLTVGLLGRSKRDQDGREPKVVHVEDKRDLRLNE